LSALETYLLFNVQYSGCE